MSADRILRTVIATEPDVFLVRQRGRAVAAALGLERQDQVRVATALSEVGRQMLAALGHVDVEFRLCHDGQPLLEMRASARGHLALMDRARGDIELARRLMDRWAIESAGGRVVVVMSRRLPPAALRLREGGFDRLRAELAACAPTTPLQELAEQNRQLAATLDQIQAHRHELLRLNAELNETNRGVLALYQQLTDEMEATNRGVVALYAELDETAARLREASETKSRFLANASHELRAPVTAVVGLLRLLMDPGSDRLTDEQHHQLDLVRRSADDLLWMVNTMLDLAKAETGRLEPEWAPVDLGGVFATLRGTMAPLIVPGGPAVVVDEPTELVPLVSDEVLLTQVLRNLLTNAIKFTPSGEVRLAARHRPAEAMLDLIVSDTGPGIAPDEQERIFEEFYRGASQASVRGTGLGLPYARRLATLLGGSLTLSSAVGEGSVFTVSLPVAPGEAAYRPSPDGSAVLIIDADEAFRARLGEVLGQAGVEVSLSAPEPHALAAASAQPPDAIVLDLRQGQPDTQRLLDTLEADERLCDIPVVVLTAFTSPRDGGLCLPRAAAVLGRAESALEALPALVRAAINRSRRT